MKNSKTKLPTELNVVWKKVVTAIPDFAKGVWKKDHNFNGVFHFHSDITDMQIVYTTKKAAIDYDFEYGFDAYNMYGDVDVDYFNTTLDYLKIIKGLKKALKKEFDDYINSNDLQYQITKFINVVGKNQAKEYLLKLLK